MSCYIPPPPPAWFDRAAVALIPVELFEMKTGSVDLPRSGLEVTAIDETAMREWRLFITNHAKIW